MKTPWRHRDMLCFEDGIQDRTGFLGIHVSGSCTESKNRQRNNFIFGLIGIGLCLREYGLFSILSKLFMYSNCSVTLSRLFCITLALFPFVFCFTTSFRTERVSSDASN